MPVVALELVAEILSLTPTLISAGVDIASLVGKTRAVLDAHAAPDDADWKALDAQCNALRTRLNADPAP